MTKAYFIGMLVWMLVSFNVYIWLAAPMFFTSGLQWSAFIAILFAPLVALVIKELK